MLREICTRGGREFFESKTCFATKQRERLELRGKVVGGWCASFSEENYGISKNGDWRRGNGPVKCVDFVEELQMERCGGLAVDLAAGTSLHGHSRFRRL